MDDEIGHGSPDDMYSLTAGEKRLEHAQISPDEWKLLCAAFANGCALCGDSKDLIPDIVVPRRLGGSSGIENIQPLCAQCQTLKMGYLVDYRPFEPLSSGLTQERLTCSQNRDGDNSTLGLQVPKMLSQKHVLAIEQQYTPPEGRLVEDPIVEYDIAPLLIEEVKRLRALIIVNPALARIESVAWRERYASLVQKHKPKNRVGKG